VEKELHFFLTSALAGGEWSSSHPSHFTPGKRASGIHLVDLRFGLGAWRKRKKICPIWGIEPWVLDGSSL